MLTSSANSQDLSNCLFCFLCVFFVSFFLFQKQKKMDERMGSNFIILDPS